METSFTPGPWKSDRAGTMVCAYGEDMKVCDIRGWGYLTAVKRLDEDAAIAAQKANANLIAQAPALVAALSAIVRLDDLSSLVARDVDIAHNERVGEAFKAARSVLAAIRGATHE